MKTLTVKFLEGAYSTSKDYHYVVDDNVKVVAGNYAVVHNSSEYKIVAVTDVTAGASSKATKTVVCVLNEDIFVDYQKRNKQAAEQKELFNRLEQLLAQENENNKYRLLANSNKEAADILAKLGLV